MAAEVVELRNIYAEREQARAFLSEAQSRVAHHQEFRDRIEEVDAILRDEFEVTTPGHDSIIEEPKIPNKIKLALEDHASLAASIAPSYRCEPKNQGDSSATAAEKRERIIYYYDQCNHADLLRVAFYTDLFATGMTLKLVMPDFNKNFPGIKRLNPRHALLDRMWLPGESPTSVISCREITLGALIADYPDADWPVIEKHRWNELVKVYDWYDSAELFRIADVPVKKESQGVFLGKRISNRLKKCPVVVGTRITHDGQFRGLYDGAIGTLKATNLIKNMLIDHAQDWISGDKVAYAIDNEEDIGTGAILRTREPTGGVRRQTPEEANPQVFALLSGMAEDVNEATVHPSARSGNISQSQGSAAFVSAITGNVATLIATAQRLEALSWEQVMGLCLETDEKYLDERKYILGSKDGKKFSESYQPSKDIKGDYGVRASYGGGAGQDALSYEIRLTQQAQNGLIARRTARENLSTVRDVLKEENLIQMERLIDAGFSLVMQQAQQGNGAPLAEFAKAIASKDEASLIEVMQALPSLVVAPEPPAATPEAPVDAFSEAGAIARGGGPTPGTNVPGVGELPPLEELGVSL